MSVGSRSASTPYHVSSKSLANEDRSSELLQQNKLEKYQIIKLVSCGDYVCNDQLGNSYLLVCQSVQSGV